MTTLTLISPAKLNLFLRVLGKRADGYHEIASLFQAIDLVDTLHFSLSEKDHLSSSGIAVPCDSSNLITRAVALFREKTALPFHINIELEKRIPTEAGLGGGSSNAATTLWGLNELLGRPASKDELQRWSSALGSDVPFFFSTGTAYCTGRGECVQSMHPFTQFTFHIEKSQSGLSTPEVYRAYDSTLTEKWEPQAALRSWMEGNPFLKNDLEQPAFHLNPMLSDHKAALITSGYKQVLMSGSGTAFFCIGNNLIYHTCHRSVESWYTKR